MRPNIWRAPPVISLFLVSAACPSGPFGVTCNTTALPVKGVLRLVTDTRNPFFQENRTFLHRSKKFNFQSYFKGLASSPFPQSVQQEEQVNQLLTPNIRQNSESPRLGVVSQYISMRSGRPSPYQSDSHQLPQRESTPCCSQPLHQKGSKGL